jgi:hypothetical protein
MSLWGLIDLQGKQVLSCEFDSLGVPTCGVMQYRTKGGSLSGLLDTRGQVVVPPRFDGVGRFDPASGTAWAMITQEGTDRYGLINTAGEFVVPADYSDIRTPYEGLVQCWSSDPTELCGYADLRGRMALPFRYRYATRFSCGLAAVTYPNDLDRYFFVDRTGSHVLGPYDGMADSDDVAFSDEGVARLFDQRTERVSFINTAGHRLFAVPRELGVDNFSGGLALASHEERKKFGFLDVSGRCAIDFKYDNAFRFIRGNSRGSSPFYTKVALAGQWGIIDRSGHEIIPPSFSADDALRDPACERILFARKPKRAGAERRWGYLSLAGEVAIAPRYSGASSFSEGYATVQE